MKNNKRAFSTIHLEYLTKYEKIPISLFDYYFFFFFCQIKKKFII